MRVRRFSLARLRDEEQGAVLAIVAISLIVLLGMLVLTFDLGRGVALKRNMVNAADAGALAAARECGLANGEASAKAAASELVADNNDAATVDRLPDRSRARRSAADAGNPDPDGKNTVTVTVSVPQEYFFAQIFGFDSGTVVASATAEWTLELSGPAPLKVEAAQGGGMPQGRDGHRRLLRRVTTKSGTASSMGWLNFPEGWPVQGEPNPPASCPSSRRRERPEGLHRADGRNGEVARLPADPVERPGLGVRQGRARTLLLCTRSSIGSTPSVNPAATGAHGRSSPSRWWRLRAALPPGRRWPRYVNPVASYPVIRFQGFYIEKALEREGDIKKAGLQDECGFSGRVPGTCSASS